MSSSSRLRSSARVGCIFCGRTGPPSSINDHLRKFVSPPHASKKLKGANYHHYDTIHAFASKSKPNAQFLKTVSQDRLAVLQAFAETITQPIQSDDDAEMWKQRDFWMRDHEHWEKNVKAVHRAYMDSDRDKVAMQEMVAQVVATVIDNDMKAQRAQLDSPAKLLDEDNSDHDEDDIDNDDEDDDDERHVLSQASLVPTVHSRQSKSANTRMQMKGPSTQHGHFRDVHSAAMNMGTHAAPKAASKKQPQVLDISSDSDSAYTPGPRKPADLSRADDHEMQPLLTLKVRAITNQLYTIPLPYPISLAAALEKVWRLGPKQLHDLDMPHKFVGDGDDPRWAGAWHELRWDEVVLAARKRHLTVELRMVLE